MIRWRKHFYLFLVFLLASFLASCQFEDDQECPGENDNVKANYINLTIAVSNGEARGTRAGEPLGGENGDGREAGFERENAVTGVTLILYQAADGINTNTSDTDPTLDFVRYFPVSIASRDPQGTTYPDYTEKTEEAYYTTGDQPIGKPNLDFSATYHAIVIANQTLPSSIVEGTSKLSALRDQTTNIVYSGSPKDPADACANFVMTSEQDNTIDFSSVTATEDAAGDKHYDLTSQTLVIERMAARIDFHAKNSTGYDATKKGYVYNVEGSTTDKFVVTGIVPFNLINGHTTYGSEYLFKRICKSISTPSVISRLEDESLTNYVIDPNTTAKTTSPNPMLTSSLESVYTLIADGTKLENTTDNPFYKSIESMHGSTTGKSTIESKDNLVVCYPMENCLLPDSKLYYYATGIAIIGYYYQNGTGTGTRYVYLSYLRHQGDAATYNVQPYTTRLATDATMGLTTPMLYGVVRNNIYRISINSVDKKGTLELKIKVKEWDPYTHDFIYM